MSPDGKRWIFVLRKGVTFSDCTKRLVKSGPNKIIAQGTDWRFLNELKKELKG